MPQAHPRFFLAQNLYLTLEVLIGFSFCNQYVNIVLLNNRIVNRGVDEPSS